MLVNWSAPQHVYIVCGKTDLWKGIDGLAMVIAENYGLELDNDSLFLFVAIVMTASKAYTGTVKDSSYFINALKMVDYDGRDIEKTQWH